MLDIDTINQSVRHYITQVTELNVDTQVLKANQDAPVPKTGSYATVLTTPIAPEGHDEVTYIDNGIDVDEKREGTRNILASINFYRDDAINFALMMQGSAYESANQAVLRAKGLGFITASDYRNLTGVDLARMEQRAQLDMFFYVIDENENVVSSVQESDVDMTFEGDNETITNTIEVRP